MKTVELIKEIDPDYGRCCWCGQLFLISDMIFTTHTTPEDTTTIYSCKDEKCIEEHKP